MSLHGSSISTARQREITERITHSIKSVLMVLAASTLAVAHWTSMSVALIRISSRSRPHVFAFSAVRRRAIAPQDNARVNRADGKS